MFWGKRWSLKETSHFSDISSAPVLGLFGARDVIFDLGREYLLYISFGALFQVLGTGLVPLIRNMGGAVFAMAAMMAGFVTNILLDWLPGVLGLAGLWLAVPVSQAGAAALGMLLVHKGPKQERA